MRLRLGTVEHDLTTRTLVVGLLRGPAGPGARPAGDDLPDAVLARADLLVAEGADALDVGGAGAGDGPADEEEELDRVVPLVRALRARLDVALAVHTSRPQVVAEACAAGAVVATDPSGFADDGYLPAAVRAGATVVAAAPGTSPAAAPGDQVDLVEEVRAFLAERVRRARAAGLADDRIIVDAGVGRGRTREQAIALLRASGALADLGPPVLLDTSGHPFASTPGAPGPGKGRSAGPALLAVGIGRGCRLVRTGDVRGARRVADVIGAILAARLAQGERAAAGGRGG